MTTPQEHPDGRVQSMAVSVVPFKNTYRATITVARWLGGSIAVRAEQTFNYESEMELETAALSDLMDELAAELVKFTECVRQVGRG